MAARTLLVLCAAFCSLPTFAGDLYFPPAEGEWQTVSPKDLGWDETALDAALQYAGESQSTGVVILHNGRMVAEKYWDAKNASPRLRRMIAEVLDGNRTREDIASVQKSVTSFLCGVAVTKGLLNIDKPVSACLGEGWSKAKPEQEGAIAVRHLMTMTSGLNAGLEYQVPPGSRWRYNTNAYAKTTKVLEAAVGKDMNALTAEWLTGPTGMRESKWEQRARLEAAVEANSIGFVTSARDLARFGLLILAGAKWNGEDLLNNPAYLKESLSPSQALNPAYGLLWWLNGQSNYVEAAGGTRVDGALVPSAPGDMVQASGALGRKCYIVPSLGLVVTRLGDQPGDPRFDAKFWGLLMKAVKR